MINWPEPLRDDIARRRAVLFIGAGVSKNSIGIGGKRPPTWEEFLRAGLKRCRGGTRHIEQLLVRRDYLTACELIKERLDEDFTRLLSDEFLSPQFSPAHIHRDLFKLDLRLVLTPNFDKIYDTYAQNESNNTIVVKNYYDSDVGAAVRGEYRAIIKAHGTIDQPARMIFTRKEYGRIRFEFSAFYALLDALVLTHTFVFLGCGLDDPDVRLMLERYAHMFPFGRPHYIVLPKGALHPDVEASTRQNMNLKAITYKADESHRELSESVHALAEQMEARRAEVARRMDW